MQALPLPDLAAQADSAAGTAAGTATGLAALPARRSSGELPGAREQLVTALAAADLSGSLR